MSDILAKAYGLDTVVRRLVLIAWLALTPFALLHGLFPNGERGEHGVALLWLALLFAYWVALTFVMANWALGSALLRRTGVTDLLPRRFTGHLFAFGVGLTASYCLLLALAMAGMLNNVGIGLYVVIVFLLSRGWKTRTAEGPNVVLTQSQKILIAGVCVAGAVWSIPYLAQTLLPNTDWDGAMYHLPLAHRFLTVGPWATDADFEQFDGAAGIHLFYSLFVKLGSEAAVIPFNFLVLLAVILGCYELACEFWGTRAGILAAVVCTSTNILWEVGLTPRIGVHLTYFTLLACYAFLLWERNPDRPKLVVLMGLMLGMTMSIKFLAVFPLAALGVCTMIVLVRERRRIRIPYRLLALATACVVIPSAYWYVRDAWQLGDPIYPFLRGHVYVTNDGQVRSLRAATYALRKRMPPSGDVIANFDQPVTVKRPKTLLNWWDMTWRPDSYARRPYYWLSPFLALFFISPLFVRNRTFWWLYALGLSIYGVTAVQTSLTRYIVSILPLFAIGAGVVLSRFTSRWATACIGCLLAIGLATNTAAELYKVKMWGPLHWLRGKESEVEWVSHVGYNGTKVMPIFIRDLNSQIRAGGEITKDDTILMVGAATSYLLDCHSLPDCSRDGQRFLAELLRADGDYGRLAKSLVDRHIHYLLVDEGYLKWVTQNIPHSKRRNLGFTIYHLNRFTSQYAQLVWNDIKVLKFYRLRAPSSH